MNNRVIAWIVISAVLFADAYDLFISPRFFTNLSSVLYWNILATILLILDFNIKYKIVERKVKK
jgi:hypothetical protein